MIAACSDSPTQVRKVAPAAETPWKAPVPGARMRTLDDDFVDLVKRAPGFGGMFIDSTGALTVYLTDTSIGATVTPAIREFAFSHRGLMRRGDDSSRSSDVVIFRRGAFDYTQLTAFLDRLESERVLNRSVTFTDIDESENRVEVGVATERDRADLAAAIAKLGLPDSAVVVTIHALANVEQKSGNLQQYFRPLLGGLQVETSVGICTLGFTALINGEHYFVTNSHCTVSFGDGSSPGYSIGQPSFYDQVGTEWYDPPLFTNAQNSSCPVGKSCRYSDAALFKINSGVEYSLGSFAPTAGANNLNWSTTTDYYWTYGTENNRVNGGWVNKIGRTTGTTGGNVSRTCVNVGQKENGIDTGRMFLCQYQASYASGAGDSGSPVEWPTGLLYYGGNELSGIHWGSGGSFSPVSNLHQELGAFQAIACFDPVYHIAPVECP
jgi:hypothetical protein